MKMVHLSCSRLSLKSSHPFRSTCISCRYAVINRSCYIQGAAQGPIVRVKAKAGVQGATAFWWGSGAKPSEADAF